MPNTVKMLGAVQSGSRVNYLMGSCVLAIAALGLNIPAASAQSTPAATNSTLAAAAIATNAAGAKPQHKFATPVPVAKVSIAKIKEPVTAAGCRTALHPGKPYFVEFRSRTAASYGHTFVFYGRLGGGTKFASFKVAGLHPKGDDASTYIAGHWIPVPAETGVSYGDLDEQYMTARFCVTLNEAEYNKVTAYIRKLQTETKTWHAPTYNCNSFAADIARFINLDTPNPNMYLPESFVSKLSEYNSKK